MVSFSSISSSGLLQTKVFVLKYHLAAKRQTIEFLESFSNVVIEYYTIYITNNHLFLRESQNNIVSIVYSTYCCINVFKYSSTLSNLSELNFCSLILQLIHIQKGW